MDKVFHGFTELFAQLGLPNDAPSIRQFIQTHSPLNSATRLEDAQFWNTAQASLLKEELLGDSDWAEVIDRLNVALNKAVMSPALSTTLEKLGAEPAQSTPDEFAATLKKEVASWGKVIHDAGIKLD